jgi:hypothetical protein
MQNVKCKVTNDSGICFCIFHSEFFILNYLLSLVTSVSSVARLV